MMTGRRGGAGKADEREDDDGEEVEEEAVYKCARDGCTVTAALSALPR